MRMRCASRSASWRRLTREGEGPPSLFVNDHRRVDGHFLMAIGADPDGRLLEIGFILTDNGEVVVLHAMDARRRWLRELTEEE